MPLPTQYTGVFLLFLSQAYRLALCGRVSTALFRENLKCSFSNAVYPSLSLFSYLSSSSSLHLASSAPLLPPYPLPLPLLPPSSLRVFKMPPTVTNRDLVQFISKQHDEATNTTYLLFRNATHPAVPERKELVRSDWHRCNMPQNVMYIHTAVNVNQRVRQYSLHSCGMCLYYTVHKLLPEKFPTIYHKTLLKRFHRYIAIMF